MTKSQPPQQGCEPTVLSCFLFAQNYHIAMKYVAPIRKELRIRTIFNILEPLAQVMAKLGVTRGMVVYGPELDFAGFVIEVARSSRCVSRDKVRELTAGLKEGILPVGVFVNAPVEFVAQLCRKNSRPFFWQEG